MMMKGGDAEDFLLSKFFTQKLYDNRYSIPYKYKRYDDKYEHGVCQHCHNSEVSSECETSYISEIKLCWLYVEPQEGDHYSNNGNA